MNNSDNEMIPSNLEGPQENKLLVLNNKQSLKKTTTTVNRMSVDFDKTDIGDECFRLVKISQTGERTPVTLSSDLPDTYQVAVGVNKLVFEDKLTFTPAEAGTFVHIRFTPDRMGQRAGSLILETATDQQTIALSGKGGSYIATPASEQGRGASGWKWVASLILLGGISYAGYAYRCQLFPSLCEQLNDVQRVKTNPKPSLPSPTQTETNEESKAEPVTQPTEAREEKTPEPTRSRTKSERQPTVNRIPARNEQNEERKVDPTPARKQQPKPAQKTSTATDESELERELNKKPGI